MRRPALKKIERRSQTEVWHRTHRFSAVIATGVHLFPFRTEKLSPPAPMVLGGQPPGRVGRRRIFKGPLWGPFFWSSSGAQALRPLWIELAQASHALLYGRMREEERSKAPLLEGVDDVKRLGCGVRDKRHQLARPFSR